MDEDELQQWPKLAASSSFVDLPQPGTSVYHESVSISGWVFAHGRDPSRCSVRAWVDGELIGETRALYVRDDVTEVLGVRAGSPTSFRILGRVPGTDEMPRQAFVTVTASWTDENVEYEIAKFAVRLVPASLARRPYGDVVPPEQTRMLHRENIYGSGPPLEEPGSHTLRLIRDYLLPHTSVVDVGCGAGAYGPPLIADGHTWMGLEVNDYCAELLARRNLPFRKAEAGAPFPCTDQEFDDAICIEVLEHIPEPEAFLAELARVTRYRTLFSVPNMEVIPYFSDHNAVPWHMLEADHKNFFTRSSLRELLLKHYPRVEVFTYAEHQLRTRDDIPLHVHLWAIADK